MILTTAAIATTAATVVTTAAHVIDVPEGAIVESAPTTLHTVWHSEADTAAWAALWAKEPLCSLVRSAYITLEGELGAGKTTLVRHLLRAWGVQGRIKSPTYAVVEPYEVGLAGAAANGSIWSIWHFDFYRFNDPEEWQAAGFRDLFAAAGLKLAEWPEKVATLAPLADVAIYLEVLHDSQRCVTLRAHTPLGSKLLQGLQGHSAA